MTPLTRPLSKRSRVPAALVATVFAMLLAACGTTDDSASDASTNGDANTESTAEGTEQGSDGEGATGSVAATDEGCTDEVTTSNEAVTLTDDFDRTVELDAPAERVVALEWQQIEDLLTLCIEPVAVADVEGYGTWVTSVDLPEGVEDVGTRGEPNIDVLVAADPDLIIVEVSGPDDPVVGTLEATGIPFLVTVGADTADPVQHMKDTFTLIAEAVGRTERAQAVIAEFDASLADAKAELEDADIAGESFLYMDGWIQDNNVSLRPFGQGSLVGEIGEELGLANVWTGEVDEAYGLGQTDIEGLADLDAQWIFHTGYDGPDPEAEDVITALTDNPIWNAHPAVAEGRVRSFPAGIWTFGGPRSSQQVIAAYLDALSG